MALAPGQKVLDACAAPGGKTCAMLEAKPGIRLHAIDIDAERAERIQDNLSRLQLNCERVVVAAAEAVDTWWDGTPYERILIDAPCSGTGVIRRHPDIRLLRRNEDIHSLAARQLNLLQQLWPTLGCGGKLVYATCSILAQENSRIVERFMHQTPDAELDMPDLPWGIDTGFGRQLLPRQDGHDGFFYARLVKKGRINSEEPLGTS
jgi:16S rRNA (cytosine967-C5)-methyltransferase